MNHDLIFLQIRRLAIPRDSVYDVLLAKKMRGAITDAEFE